MSILPIAKYTPFECNCVWSYRKDEKHEAKANCLAGAATDHSIAILFPT